jgi:putative addiction module killer protein
LEAIPREILACEDRDGGEPFTEWLDSVPLAVRAIVEIRIDRVEDGNFGDVKSVGDGISELRIDVGPGYRVYFGQVGKQVHLIGGGTKSTQDADIANAKDFWSKHE